MRRPQSGDSLFQFGKRGEATGTMTATRPTRRRRPGTSPSDKPAVRRQPLRRISRARRLRGRSAAAPAAHALWLHFRRRRDQCVTEANLDSYQDYAFVPRVLVDVSRRSHAKMLFGRAYAAPFGIAPMGAAAICAYRGDLVCAQAAADANIPMILSGASLIRLEEVRAASPDRLVPGLSAGRRLAHRTAGRSRRRRGLRGVRADRGHTGRGQPREQRAQPASAFRSSRAPSWSGTW